MLKAHKTWMLKNVMEVGNVLKNVETMKWKLNLKKQTMSGRKTQEPE